MASEVYQTVENCSTCPRSRERTNCKRHLKLFPASRPLEFVAMGIFGPLPRAKNRNGLIINRTSRYSKTTREISTSKTTARHVSAVFLDHCIVPYGIPDNLLTDNGPRFVNGVFFPALCGFFPLKHLTTTAYYPQTSAQVERYKKTIVGSLRHQVAKHQDS